MVKNTTGGCKAKGQARKFMNAPKESKVLRIVKEEGEEYAQVQKLLGNGMCHVLTLDGKTRLCFIRGKFRGRGKKDNLLSIGTWILVGLREWESDNGKDLLKCDLLEVYSDLDREALKTNVRNNWSCFMTETTGGGSGGGGGSTDEFFEFCNEKTEEYKELMERDMEHKKKLMTPTTTSAATSGGGSSVPKKQQPVLITMEDEENEIIVGEINVDDI